MNDKQVQRNIEEFVEEHGVEGFFLLYIREYLFELLSEEIYAATGEEDTDSSIQLYFSQDVTTDSEVEEFEEQLRGECADRAEEVVDGIKSSEELRPLFEDGEISLLERKEVEELVKEALHEIIEEWEDEI